jgi:hypothetical protein
MEGNEALRECPFETSVGLLSMNNLRPTHLNPLLVPDLQVKMLSKQTDSIRLDDHEFVEDYELDELVHGVIALGHCISSGRSLESVKQEFAVFPF